MSVPWSALTPALPPAANMAKQRWQDWILDQLGRGNHPPLEWFEVAVRSEVDGRDVTAVFRISNRVRLGNAEDSVLPITSGTTAQDIADYFEAVVPTALLYDHIATQGDLISYVDLPARDVANLTAAQMVANSRAIDARRKPGVRLYEAGKSTIADSRYNDPGPPGRTGPTGLRNGRDTMVNYGAGLKGPAGPGGKNPWRSVSLPGELRVWQPKGGTGKFWHTLRHVDISQKAPHIVSRQVAVYGGKHSGAWDIEDLAAHRVMWKLVSDSGPITSMRIGGSGSTPGGAGAGGGPVPGPAAGGGSGRLLAAVLLAGAIAIYALS